MRLFVAVEIDPLVVEKLARCVDELSRRVESQAPRARVTWVATDRMHVTVRFIGEVDEVHSKRIVSALGPETAVAPFVLACHGVGTFPERGAPRVVWAGIGAGADGLAALEREVSARLAECGIAPEERGYHPHVTLARVRDPRGLQTRSLTDGFVDHPFGTSRVDAITLFHSRPSPKGATYVPLQTTSLLSPDRPRD